MQMVCDASFRILNVVAKWPGSVHDARIFRESRLCQVLENGNINSNAWVNFYLMILKSIFFFNANFLAILL